MKEATVTENIVAEKPKSKKHKEGTPDPAVKQAKAVTKAIAKGSKYRILDGVDAGKYRGQRSIVVKALQSLGDGFFTLEEIASKCDGLVSKTPVEASAKYHLKGLQEEGAVEIQEAPKAVKATEEVEEDEAA